MSYVSGNLQTFNNRLHQLPSNTGDLFNFRSEGVNYTYSSGYSQQLNKEYRKWYYSFTQNPSFLTGWYLNIGGQPIAPSSALIGWLPNSLGINWQSDIEGGLSYSLNQSGFQAYSESQRSQIQGIGFFSSNNSITGIRLRSLTGLNNVSYPNLIAVSATNSLLTGLDFTSLTSLITFTSENYNNNRLTSLNFAGTNITAINYAYALSTGFSGIQYINISGTSGLNLINFTNAFKNTSAYLDQFMVDLATFGAPNGIYSSEGNVAFGASGVAAQSALEARGWTFDIL
jgi:hypothetical protein